jgi:dephospho-CoA kinase
MKIIGLCGGSGSGKGTVSAIFLEMGIPSVDTDAVYHEMTCYDSPCLQALRHEFGQEIVDQSDSLDRAKLASIVFNDVEKLDKLNRITHAFILGETRKRLEVYKSQGYSAALVDAPVLFESGFDSECDEIICVIADPRVRIERIVARDKITEHAARSRIDRQISNDELITRCDYVIYNNDDMVSLRANVSEIAKIILKNKTKGDI